MELDWARREKMPADIVKAIRLENQAARLSDGDLRKRIESLAILHPLWSGWADSHTGIGPYLAGRLIGEIGGRVSLEVHTPKGFKWLPHPEILSGNIKARLYKEVDGTTGRVRQGIDCFPTVSGLWAYGGFGVSAGRAQKLADWSYNPDLKGVVYETVESCMRKSDPVYANYCRRAQESCLPRQARRKTAKLLLKDIWVAWKSLQGAGGTH